MSACAGEEITDPDERQLYARIDDVFTEFCGEEFERYAEREQRFIAVASNALDTLAKNRDMDREARV